jgi:hypothetical protein
LRTDRLGTDVFLSSLGVIDLSWRTEATEGERDMLVLLGVEGRDRGIFNGGCGGAESSRGALVVLLETFLYSLPFLNLSLCGVVALVVDPFTDPLDSTEGNAMSGSRSIFPDRRTSEAFVC